jgi:hypothetical protein
MLTRIAERVNVSSRSASANARNQYAAFSTSPNDAIRIEVVRTNDCSLLSLMPLLSSDAIAEYVLEYSKRAISFYYNNLRDFVKTPMNNIDYC